MKIQRDILREKLFPGINVLIMGFRDLLPLIIPIVLFGSIDFIFIASGEDTIKIITPSIGVALFLIPLIHILWWKTRISWFFNKGELKLLIQVLKYLKAYGITNAKLAGSSLYWLMKRMSERKTAIYYDLDLAIDISHLAPNFSEEHKRYISLMQELHLLSKSKIHENLIKLMATEGRDYFPGWVVENKTEAVAMYVGLEVTYRFIISSPKITPTPIDITFGPSDKAIPHTGTFLLSSPSLMWFTRIKSPDDEEDDS